MGHFTSIFGSGITLTKITSGLSESMQRESRSQPAIYRYWWCRIFSHRSKLPEIQPIIQVEGKRKNWLGRDNVRLKPSFLLGKNSTLHMFLQNEPNWQKRCVVTNLINYSGLGKKGIMYINGNDV